MKNRSRFILLTDGLGGQDGGVQRVSRTVFEVARSDSASSWIWSSNDSSEACRAAFPNLHVRCFDRNYALMMGAALLARSLPSKCDRIFCWHLSLLPAAAILAWRLGCPLDLFLHGIEAWGILRPRVRCSMRRVDSFAANSEYTLRRFRGAHPFFADRPGRIVSLGLNREFLEAKPTIHPVIKENSAPYFLAVTRFGENYKGEDTLLSAFGRVRQSHPGLRLLCVGDGPSRTHWQARAVSMGMGESVHFVGRVSDAELSGLYAHCLGFILLSEGEGFGIVFLEAMYHGKPCIATDADASQEIVVDGQTGFLTRPRDPESVATVMRKLMEDPLLARRLGEEGRDRVRKTYLPEHFQERVRQYLSETPRNEL